MNSSRGNVDADLLRRIPRGRGPVGWIIFLVIAAVMTYVGTKQHDNAGSRGTPTQQTPGGQTGSSTDARSPDASSAGGAAGSGAGNSGGSSADGREVRGSAGSSSAAGGVVGSAAGRGAPGGGVVGSAAGRGAPGGGVVRGAAGDADFAQLARDRRSRVQVQASGTIIKTLPDDTEGDQHQRFLVRAGGETILIAHNIDLAQRVPVREGDSVRFAGEYEWNDRGGVVHWTHRDPAHRHPDGWIEIAGKRYQ